LPLAYDNHPLIFYNDAHILSFMKLYSDGESLAIRVTRLGESLPYIGWLLTLDSFFQLQK
jgi:hypothetical protein